VGKQDIGKMSAPRTLEPMEGAGHVDEEEDTEEEDEAVAEVAESML